MKRIILIMAMLAGILGLRAEVIPADSSFTEADTAAVTPEAAIAEVAVEADSAVIINVPTLPSLTTNLIDFSEFEFYTPQLDTTSMAVLKPSMKCRPVPTIYRFSDSWTRDVPDARRMWINTAVLTGAFVSTLFVLECLPEDATSWNRASIQNVPPLKRWYRNVFKRGPHWDNDLFIFNYVLHPYAGAAYFMGARSCGYNFWKSMLYSACISTFGWEFGIEAFMERPSYQDLVITPGLGSLLGECFYKAKLHLVNNGYRLWGSKALGNIAAFIVDPVNEVVGLFTGNPAREYSKELESERRQSRMTSSLLPFGPGGTPGFTLTVRF